jgi:hypothetical protein
VNENFFALISNSGREGKEKRREEKRREEKRRESEKIPRR